jgi:hypothetical protein
MTSNNAASVSAETHSLLEGAQHASEEAAEQWHDEWLKFPTVSLDVAGGWHYWDVAADTHVYSTDWKVGEGLARDTVAQMQRFPAGSSVLRRILREIDFNSLVAQGFLARVEDMLTNPQVFLQALEPGSVQAKLTGKAPIPHWKVPAADPAANGSANASLEDKPSSGG